MERIQVKLIRHDGKVHEAPVDLPLDLPALPIICGYDRYHFVAKEDGVMVYHQSGGEIRLGFGREFT